MTEAQGVEIIALLGQVLANQEAALAQGAMVVDLHGCLVLICSAICGAAAALPFFR